MTRSPQRDLSVFESGATCPPVQPHTGIILPSFSFSQTDCAISGPTSPFRDNILRISVKREAFSSSEYDAIAPLKSSFYICTKIPIDQANDEHRASLLAFYGQFRTLISAFYASCSNQQSGMKQFAAREAHFSHGMQALLINSAHRYNQVTVMQNTTLAATPRSAVDNIAIFEN